MELAGRGSRLWFVAHEAHPLVGRDPVLADVRGAVQRALTGRGGLLLVTGKAGIGKTALAAETAAYARSAGAAVGWAACSADDGAPGFWPWLQIFRSLGDPGHSSASERKPGVWRSSTRSPPRC